VSTFASHFFSPDFVTFSNCRLRASIIQKTNERRHTNTPKSAKMAGWKLFSIAAKKPPFVNIVRRT
jgi:hypothetical protein